MQKPAASALCPCHHGKFGECCLRFLSGRHIPENALELMRSRYTAYVLGNENYLKATWYISSRPFGKLLDKNTSIKWINLKIISHKQDNKWGEVEFIAQYKINGKAQKLHEKSRFVKEDDRWYYLDGDLHNKP